MAGEFFKLATDEIEAVISTVTRSGRAYAGGRLGGIGEVGRPARPPRRKRRRRRLLVLPPFGIKPGPTA